MTSERNEADGVSQEWETPQESGGGQTEGEPSIAGGAESMPEAEPVGTQEGGEDVRRELQDLRERHLRLAAEYDNYRKRTERERLESAAKAQGKLVQSLLDAVDDLERVADFTEETTTVVALLEGVQMVERKLLKALESAGLERLDAHGAPFDPNEHEALMTTEAEHPHEDETVGEVFQKGYRFQGHLLRPARVQVRKHGG